MAKKFLNRIPIELTEHPFSKAPKNVKRDPIAEGADYLRTMGARLIAFSQAISSC